MTRIVSGCFGCGSELSAGFLDERVCVLAVGDKYQNTGVTALHHITVSHVLVLIPYHE